jgi:tRNA (cmo5U34)-methyltransferase
MSDFQQTEWYEAEKAAYFRDHASRYIPDRARMQELLASLLSHVLAPRFPDCVPDVLELGCGDGVLSQALMLRHSSITVTLLDGSRDMLDAAEKRFGSDPRVRYIQATLQDVIAGRTDLGTPHFIVSSLAIHHLTLAEKAQLFACAAHALVPGGAFANVDVVLSPAACVEEWYLELWRDWIREHDAIAADGKSFTHIPTQYKHNADNFPDPLQEQLRQLEGAGFDAVDVFFKSGVFAVYGGFKP